jgi:hypothetical protein
MRSELAYHNLRIATGGFAAMADFYKVQRQAFYFRIGKPDLSEMNNIRTKIASREEDRENILKTAQDAIKSVKAKLDAEIAQSMIPKAEPAVSVNEPVELTEQESNASMVAQIEVGKSALSDDRKIDVANEVKPVVAPVRRRGRPPKATSVAAEA